MDSVLQSLEISYFIQATEDEEKVRVAVSSLVGGEQLPEERQEAEGHHGNKIVLIRHHLTGEAATSALQKVLARMADEEKRVILGDLASGLDEHNALYVRLNKQVLVMSGRAVLGKSDPVRIRVKPWSFVARRDPSGFYARLLTENGSRD